MSQYYETKHLLLVVGANMNFEKAEYYYMQLENMMTQFNKVNPDIQLAFSTLTQYNEMVSLHDKPMSSYYYDMTPFSDDGQRYFSGQYTSRPNLKKAIREASKLLNSANKLLLSQIFGKSTNDALAKDYLQAL